MGRVTPVILPTAIFAPIYLQSGNISCYTVSGLGEFMSFSEILPIVARYAVPVIMAFVIFVIGRKVANKLSAGTASLLNKSPNSDPSLSRFFASVVRYLLLVVVIMAALTVLGVNTSSITGMIMGLGAAMAFVLQGALGNLAAGVMVLLFRPYSVGDEVEIDGTKGVVTAIELTATRMTTRDNVELIVANGKAWNGIVRNHTALGARRLDMDFGIDYDANIDTAIEVITRAAAQDPRVHSEPAPWAKVILLNESSVDLQLRVWSDYSDLRGLKVALSQPIKEALDAAGIGIPYPHEVKIKQSVKTSKARDRRQKLNALKLKNS